MGLSSLGHTTRPPPSSPHLAEIPATLSQTAWTRIRELWLEYLDQERLQYDEREVLSLWEKVQSEPTFLQTQNLGFTDYTSLSNGMNLSDSISKTFPPMHCCISRQRIMSNLEKHTVPLPAPELQELQAPVAEVPPSCLTDSKASAKLVQQDLGVLQDQARVAVAREAQQVAMEQELLEGLPLLFKNRPEQVNMALECKGKGGQPCQGAANITVTVFIQGNAKECGRVLKTILEQRLLCPLISPFFTPNAAPDQFVFLYQDVVTSLHLDTADVIFMLLTKVCSHT
ncbi:hypothetical protein GOODEAATRI_014490 [Goodea atripinnis]|uniref:Epg5-like central TPR repeats domain-containing protein n=1 Tax=Goodea atripinnis TaxID=208336 RepID=A0ABV0N1D7_9TELE